MNAIRYVFRLAAALLMAAAASAAWAATDAPQTSEAQRKDAICTRCHDETEAKPVLSIYDTRHGVKADARTPTCQSCHGESTRHVNNPDGTETRPATDVPFGKKAGGSAQLQAATCLTCHDGGQRANWMGSEHQRRDMSCSSCHQIHTRNDTVLNKQTQMDVCFDCHKTQRAQIHRVSTHPLQAGQMSCSGCHNPHGSVGPKLMVKNSVNETCYTCHAERRGPFLWEHSPVTEDCTNCHTPHGSNNPSLLVKRTPWLCQDCHTQDHARDVNSAANLPDGDVTTIDGRQPIANRSPRAQMNGRNCLACHPMVHGSNHPAGGRFSR